MKPLTQKARPGKNYRNIPHRAATEQQTSQVKLPVSNWLLLCFHDMRQTLLYSK